MIQVVIIGNGPTAAAAHMAIVDSGKFDTFKVTVIGPNHRNDIKFAAEPLLKTNPENLRANLTAFDIDSSLQHKISGSSEFGGWSNYWGATMLPLPQEYLNEREIAGINLREGIEAVSKYVPIKFRIDDLSNKFLVQKLKNLNHKKLNHLSEVLKKNVNGKSNILIGESMLAIERYSEDSFRGCIECGKCMEGCKFDQIWSSRKYFDNLNDDNLEFLEGYALNLKSDANKPTVRISYLNDKYENCEIECHLVFVAAGVLVSPMILMNSGFINEAIINESPVTLVPFILPKFKKIPINSKITLSESFLIQNIEEKIENHIFMQCYSVNPELRKKILSKYRILSIVPKQILDNILQRVGIAMVFEDQIYGGKIKITHNQDRFQLSVERESNKINLKKNIIKLKNSGIRFIWSLRQSGKVGESFHLGATSLIKDQKEINFDYINGQIEKRENIYLVDSTSLERVTCYPTTFASMANSYRITQKAINKNYMIR